MKACKKKRGEVEREEVKRRKKDSKSERENLDPSLSSSSLVCVFHSFPRALRHLSRSLVRTLPLGRRRRNSVAMPAFENGGVGGPSREGEGANASASTGAAPTTNARPASTNRVRQLASSWPPPPTSTATDSAQNANKMKKQGNQRSKTEEKGGEKAGLHWQLLPPSSHGFFSNALPRCLALFQRLFVFCLSLRLHSERDNKRRGMSARVVQALKERGASPERNANAFIFFKVQGQKTNAHPPLSLLPFLLPPMNSPSHRVGRHPEDAHVWELEDFCFVSSH